MTPDSVPSGIRPPVQARSRAALERVLASAERVLAASGSDDFTMAAVARESGVSIGGIYRRFQGREQLLAAVKDRLITRLETDLAERLATADPCLDGIVCAFTHALTDTLGGGSAYLHELMAGQSDPMAERGARALVEIRRLFEEKAAPYADEVLRSEPAAALAAVERTIVGACVHLAAGYRHSPDDLSWTAYGDQLCDMALAYLKTPDRPASPVRH